MARKQKVPHIYAEVTLDKYQLIIHFADTAQELAEICGVSIDTVYTYVSKGARGLLPQRFIVIYFEENDNE